MHISVTILQNVYFILHKAIESLRNTDNLYNMSIKLRDEHFKNKKHDLKHYESLKSPVKPSISSTGTYHNLPGNMYTAY
jgi:hypothetical protein